MSPAATLPLPHDVSAPLREFADYWQSLPKTNLLPRLADYFDHAVAHLQPYVAVIDVHAAADMRIRLFGTGLVQRMNFDPTGHNLDWIYPEDMRARVHRMLWNTVTGPAGYLCTRTSVTGRGIVNEHPSIGLPIDIPTSGIRGVVTFSSAVAETGRIDDQDKADLVRDITIDRWIDIGAGTPD